MGTLNAIYVRVIEPAKVAALLAEYPTAYTELGTEFYAIDQPDDRFEPPDADLAQLSVRLATDILWLGFQSVVDAFQFHHWRSGKHLRALVYGCFRKERTWERVEGEPEPWERGAFFDLAHLAFGLKYTTEEEVRELRRVWREEEIAPGRVHPSIDGRESARTVAEFYRLPGWYLEPDAA